METKELDNLKRDDFLRMLKDKLKREINSNIFFIILVILILFFSVQRLLDNPKNSFDFIIVLLWGWFLLYKGWFTLFNYRFLKKVDNLDTPDRLLRWLEKSYRYKMIGGIVSCIILLLFGIFLFKTGLDFWGYVGAIGIVIIAIVSIVSYFRGGSGWYRKEKDMIEQLRELIEKK